MSGRGAVGLECVNGQGLCNKVMYILLLVLKSKAFQLSGIWTLSCEVDLYVNCFSAFSFLGVRLGADYWSIFCNRICGSYLKHGPVIWILMFVPV